MKNSSDSAPSLMPGATRRTYGETAHPPPAAATWRPCLALLGVFGALLLSRIEPSQPKRRDNHHNEYDDQYGPGPKLDHVSPGTRGLRNKFVVGRGNAKKCHSS